MSTKVDLGFTRALDLELIEKGVKIWLTRIVAEVCFKAKDNNWTQPYRAIIDTGAPVSLIPPAIWHEIDAKILAEHKISGIVPHQECSLPLKVAHVTCKIMSKSASTNELSINTYLTPTDKVPLIIGFDNLLEELKLVSDYKTKIAYFET